MDKVVGMIPIKLRNQRLPGKNIKQLGNKALCEYLFETVRNVSNLDKVYVFCSDESICKYIPKGVNFLQRPAELDADTIKSRDILNAFINTIKADVYALMHVTQPFLRAESIQTVISKVVEDDYDSAFTAHEIREFTWFKGKTLNYSLTDVVRTQELEPVYTEGELFVFKREVFTKMGRRIGDKPYIYPISWKENVCIDDINDFQLAEAVVALGGYDES